MDDEAPRSDARNLAWGEDFPTNSSSASTTGNVGGPSRFFFEALKAARLRRPATASGEPTPIDETPQVEEVGACDATSTSPSDSAQDAPATESAAASSLVSSSASSVARTPAPPPGPRPAGRPRSAMASLAGAVVAKAAGTSSNSDEAECTATPPTISVIKDVDGAGTTDGKHINSAFSIKDTSPSDAKVIGGKHGSRDFVDPRLERLHFLQAVQRMRSRVADGQQMDGDALAQKVSADLMSGIPQRPKSAVARLRASEKEGAQEA